MSSSDVRRRLAACSETELFHELRMLFLLFATQGLFTRGSSAVAVSYDSNKHTHDAVLDRADRERKNSGTCWRIVIATADALNNGRQASSRCWDFAR